MQCLMNNPEEIIMKKFFLTLILTIMTTTTSALALPEEITELEQTPQPSKTELKSQEEIETPFDWLEISQEERNDSIEKYKNLLFENNTSKIYFDKDEFKSTFKPYLKDRNFKYHYMLTNNGVTEDEDAKYCAFYYKNDTLMIYAIQYKNNPRQAFYYSAFGKMYYTDLMSDEYPNFPYTSMQYDRKGKLSSAIYFVSQDLQYMFGPDKEFQGIWYKDKMYDKNGKQTLTRTNW